jgi:hypothetical protein
VIRYWLSNLLLLLIAFVGLFSGPLTSLVAWLEKGRSKLIIGQINADRSRMVSDTIKEFSFKTDFGNNSKN